jgi:hypothetical protein
VIHSRVANCSSKGALDASTPSRRGLRRQYVVQRCTPRTVTCRFTVHQSSQRVEPLVTCRTLCSSRRSLIMSFKSTPACHLSANFSSATPLHNRPLLSTASHDAISPPLPVFTFGSSSPTAIVPSRVRQAKKSSRHLNTNSVLVSSDSPPLLKNLLPHHRAQLQNAWATSPRVPTVKSRQAWAKARNLPPLAVHNWFNRRKSRAKLTNQPMTEGTYDLVVGNPGEGFDINEEIRPDTFELSPAADSFLSTPSLVPDSPVPITNSFVPRSSPHSPIVHDEPVKTPVCTKKVTPKRRSAAKAKPSAVSAPAGR